MGVFPKPESRAGFYAGLGVILLLAAIWVTAANESVVAHWHAGMARPEGEVLVLGNRALPGIGQQGQMVLVSGTPEVVEPARDPDFRVRVDTPLLQRRVEMFQWHELHLGGRITYQMDWIEHAVDSSRFEQPRGHANPNTFPFVSKPFTAPSVRLGHYLLGPKIVRALPGVMQPVKPDFQQLPANLQASFREQGDYLTTSTNPRMSSLGDLRVEWLAKPLHEVTVVAKLHGNLLQAGAGSAHDPGFQVWLGKQSLTDVFPGLPLQPPGMWFWRILGVLFALIGAVLLLRSLEPPRKRALWTLGIALGVLVIPAGLAWLLA